MDKNTVVAECDSCNTEKECQEYCLSYGSTGVSGGMGAVITHHYKIAGNVNIYVCDECKNVYKQGVSESGSTVNTFRWWAWGAVVICFFLMLIVGSLENVPKETRQSWAMLAVGVGFFCFLAAVLTPMLATGKPSDWSTRRKFNDWLWGFKARNIQQQHSEKFTWIPDRIADPEADSKAVKKAEIEDHVEDFRKEGWSEEDLEFLEEILDSDEK